MNSEAFEQWFKMNKNLNMSSLNGWNKNINDALCQIAEKQLDCISDCVSNSCSTLSEQFKQLSRSKPENFLAIQKESINQGMSAWLSNTQKILNTSVETMEEISKLYAHRDMTAFIYKKAEKETG